MKSKISLSVLVICLIFVLVGCSGVVSPINEATEPTANFQETISSLDTPEKLSDWMLKNIKYESHYGLSVGRLSPEEIFESKCGCCAEFAIFACAVLEYHGYETEIFTISVASDPSKGHAVCAYHSSSLLNIINVGRIEGPYQTYQDIAFDLNKDWSEYHLYYSWSTYQELGYPDEFVYRE
ncbi:transglutaminase-like domain-containing protein [bacterium]|nr:transglutaminase-like domain-containing protein [bacterium]